MKKVRKSMLRIVVILIVIGITIGILFEYQANKKVYMAKDFGVEVITSEIDYNHNGIDDYTDILLGAKKDANNKPTYRSAYYAGGYPPEEEGVCTDVIWRAFKNAGYSLKDLVDEDIKNNIAEYPRTKGKSDPNIDFRRVPNLKKYFQRHANSLTNDISEIKEWQPGDIVVFGTSHIGIISDKRNKKGIPYLIHNASQPLREEDALEQWDQYEKITGHYRI